MALSVKAKGNILILAERHTSARIGKPINPSKNKLGTINTQLGESLFFVRWIDRGVELMDYSPDVKPHFSRIAWHAGEST